MSLATIVKGNTFSLAIPLQVYAVEDGELVLRDYTPESGDAITVRLKGERRNYTYIPSTNGNIAYIHLEGCEVVGVYAVEVEIVKDDGSKLTSYRFDQLNIVESIDELSGGQITEGIEQGAIYLDPEIFIAGKDGRGIVSITLTGTSGLVDTYTITYTDNTTSTFTVTNGEDGRSEQSDWAQTDPSADDYIKNKPSLATVATSGSYNDLLNKPTLPAAQVQSDWNVSDISSKAYIKNKPTIDTALSSTSTNAVQNKVVKAALDTKVNTSDLASVTEDSEGADMVGYGTKTDGGTTTNVTVKDALDEIYESIGDGGDLATRVTALEEGKEDKFFIISVTKSGNSFVKDKLDADIKAAYRAGKKLMVKYTTTSGTTVLLPLVYIYEPTLSTFVFQAPNDNFTRDIRAQIDGDEVSVTVVAYQSALTFDESPTANSDNPVKSGGVYSALQEKQDTIADLSVIRSGAALGATAYQKPSTGIPKTDLANDVQTSLGKADTALQQHQDLSAYADGAEYDSANHLIYLKHGNTRLANPINAKDFIKDGMVDTVEIANGNLVITFNTDAGKQPITIPLTDIFNPADYYTKTQIDNAGYLTSESDPVFSSSAAAGITSSDITNWNSKTSNTGTVTSVGMSVPFGLSVSGSPVTSSGTLAVTFTTGYSIPTTAKQSNWDAAYTDKHTHSNKSVLDGISSSDITNWNAAEPNVQSDWDATTGDAAILNKPTIPTVGTLSTNNATTQTVPTSAESLSGAIKLHKVSKTGTYSDLIGTPSLAAVATSGDYGDLNNTPSLATVATSGSYNDLSNKPTIPTVNNATLTIQKNGTTVNTFTANASSNVTANITVPTKVSDLTNDSGFITSYTETDPVFSASAAASITSSDITAWNNKQNALTFDTAPTASSTNPVTSGGVKTALDAKQATLVSGTSIKTVNNTSLLGSGNVAVQPTLVSGTNIKTVNSTSLLGSGDVTINGSNVNYTGSTGNVITANTSVNTALAAIDTAIGNVETLLANI